MKRIKTFAVASFAIMSFGILPMESQAELPSEVTLRYNVTRSAGRKLDGVAHRITARLGGATLALGESCDLIFYACGQLFTPAALASDEDGRRCEGQEIGVVSLGAGDNSGSLRTRSRVLSEKRRNRGRQISVQFTADCTDGTNEVELTSPPRARKLSVNAGKGASIQRVIRQMIRNFSG